MEFIQKEILNVKNWKEWLEKPSLQRKGKKFFEDEKVLNENIEKQIKEKLN